MIGRRAQPRPNVDPLYTCLISNVAPTVSNSLVSWGGSDVRGVNYKDYYWRISTSNYDHKVLYKLMGRHLEEAARQRGASVDGSGYGIPIGGGKTPPFHYYRFWYTKGTECGRLSAHQLGGQVNVGVFGVLKQENGK